MGRPGRKKRIERDLQRLTESVARIEVALARQSLRLEGVDAAAEYLCEEPRTSTLRFDRIDNRLESHHERLRILDAKLDRLITLATRPQRRPQTRPTSTV